MRAMTLLHPRQALVCETLADPVPGPGQVLLKMCACGVCRTDLQIVDGDLPPLKHKIVPGHEIVGRVVRRGEGVDRFAEGDRVGVPWLGWTCGTCRYCHAGQENLCEKARFTGYDIAGGYADLTIADARFCFPIPAQFSDVAAAPLLCAGLIGYRCLRMAEDAKRLGLYGFGAAAHILAQVATHQGRKVYAFTRSGDVAAQAFAMRLGAAWAGSSGDAPPELLDAAIIFAPVGSLVPEALRAVRPGGVVVCGGIHMSDIPRFPYELLWRERVLRSVANLTRQDGVEFFACVSEMKLDVETHPWPLVEANQALSALREGRFVGAAVLVP
jgi:propanol-preferring alcohol dehydrogenase